MKTKRCTGECGEIKPLEEFHNDKNTKDGKRYICKACASACKREYRAKKSKIKKELKLKQRETREILKQEERELKKLLKLKLNLDLKDEKLASKQTSRLATTNRRIIGTLTKRMLSKQATANRRRTRILYDRFEDCFRALALQADVLETPKEERTVMLKKEDWNNTCLVNLNCVKSFEITWE